MALEVPMAVPMGSLRRYTKRGTVNIPPPIPKREEITPTEVPIADSR